MWNNSIVVCDVSDDKFEDRFELLTKPADNLIGDLVWSHDGSMIAYCKAVKDEGQKEAFKQIFIVRI
jgi:hypothetical protein